MAATRSPVAEVSGRERLVVHPDRSLVVIGTPEPGGKRLLEATSVASSEGAIIRAALNGTYSADEGTQSYLLPDYDRLPALAALTQLETERDEWRDTAEDVGGELKRSNEHRHAAEALLAAAVAERDTLKAALAYAQAIVVAYSEGRMDSLVALGKIGHRVLAVVGCDEDTKQQDHGGDRVASSGGEQT